MKRFSASFFLILMACLPVLFCPSRPAWAIPVTFDIVVEGVSSATPVLPFGMSEIPTGILGSIVVDISGSGDETVYTSTGTITEFSLSFGPASFTLANVDGSLRFLDGSWWSTNSYASGITGIYSYDDTHRHRMSLGNYWLYGADKLFIEESVWTNVTWINYWVNTDVALVERTASPVPEPAT